MLNPSERDTVAEARRHPDRLDSYARGVLEGLRRRASGADVAAIDAALAAPTVTVPPPATAPAWPTGYEAGLAAGRAARLAREAQHAGFASLLAGPASAEDLTGPDGPFDGLVARPGRPDTTAEQFWAAFDSGRR